MRNGRNDGVAGLSCRGLRGAGRRVATGSSFGFVPSSDGNHGQFEHAGVAERLGYGRRRAPPGHAGFTGGYQRQLGSGPIQLRDRMGIR